MFDRAPVGYLTLTGDGRITRINFAASRLLGVSRENFKGVNVNTFIRGSNELQKLLGHLRRCRGDEINVATSLVLRSADGASVPVELISYPVGDKPHLYHTAIIDLTEHRRADVTAKWLAAIVESSGNAIIGEDLQGVVTSWNRGAEALFGYPASEIIGRPLPITPPREELDILERVRRDEHIERFEAVRQRKDGSCVEVSLTVSSIKDEDGKIIGASKIIHDITERKRAEKELEWARDEAMAASRAKDNFLAALSHELRTPLNPVLLLASDAAKNRDLPPRARTDFDTIRKNVELEARLIDDLLDITRITRDRLALERRPVDAHAVLHDAISTAQGEIERKKITLRVRLKAAQYTILGDPVRLQQVFWNVLKNAAKFTPESGKIIVETQNIANEKIAVKISDTGIGMEPNEVARVFDAFSQGDHMEKTGSHRFGGLGLGLAISRALVEKQSGRIRAQSDGRGRGAAFTIEFPIIANVEPDTDAKPGGPFKRPARKKPAGTRPVRRHILLVEDHEPTRTSLTQLLLRRNYRVSAAASLAEARALARKEKFDLLVSDIGLPDGSGFDLMRELREHHGLKGVALTGYGMEEDVRRSYDAGFVTHLTKPVRMESLDEALAAATEIAVQSESN